MPAKSLKAADKQTILKKLITEMKRRFGGSVPKQNRPAFETLLYAICLEDVGSEEADAAYTQLLEPFFDMNEIRVSSVSQIEEALGDLRGADWKALRIREALQHVFEKFYAFDLEFLKRKTQEQAVKELAQIPYQTPFVRGYVVQHVLGAHVLPIDHSALLLLQWLGLADAGMDGETAAEEIKAGIKKADGVLLCHLLKSVSVDPELREHFEDPPTSEDETDPFTCANRLADLFKNPQKKKKKPKPAAPAAKAPPAKAAAAVKVVTVKKPAKKAPERAVSGKAKPAAAVRKVTKKVPAPAKKTDRKRTK
ncbi:hypothetical protein SH661x_001647 [Planctomicrobium sp. SH661]|uniref:hypothetical protein n=1 Tax=Planctomicrobium sp. SH661 TaxID=3448124 RepID=UPI003F5B0D8E